MRGIKAAVVIRVYCIGIELKQFLDTHPYLCAARLDNSNEPPGGLNYIIEVALVKSTYL